MKKYLFILIFLIFLSLISILYAATQSSPTNPTFASTCTNWSYSEVDNSGYANGVCDTGITRTADGSGSFRFEEIDSLSNKPAQPQTDYMRVISEVFTSPSSLEYTNVSAYVNATLSGTYTGTGYIRRIHILNPDNTTNVTCYEDTSYLTNFPSTWDNVNCSPSLSSDSDYRAQVEVEFVNNVKADTFTIYWHIDEVYVNFTYTPPNPPPQWSNNQSSTPATYQVVKSNFSVEWSDDSDDPAFDVAFFSINITNCPSPSGGWCNFTASENGNFSYYNITLGAGDYSWKFYANDSSDGWNATDTWTFTINQANNPADLYFNNGTEYKNDNVTITYGTQTNVTGIIEYTSGNLYRNDSDANSENNIFITLPGGSWQYTVNTSGNQNYSANSTSYFIFVNKASITVYLYLNGTPNDNRTYTYPEAVNATGTSSALTPSLYRNGVYKGTDEQILLGNGTYAYKVNATGNENYTDNSTGITYYALVNKGTVQPTLSINTTWTETYPTATNVSCSVTSQNNEVSCNLYRNDTGSVSNPDEILLGVGAYDYTTNTSETGNYSANTTGESKVLTISQGTLSLSLSITPSNSVTYPTQTTADGSETNSGDSDITYELWRNTTQVSEPETITLGANVYEYRYNATGGANWTANATGVTDILTVSQNNTNPVNLYLNATPNDNRTYTYPEAVNATGAMVYSNSGTALLWRNGVSKSNPEEILLGNGTYAYKVNTSGNDNYTANDTGITFYALVNKGDVNISLWLNGSENDRTYTQNQGANFTALINVTGLTINLTSNYTGWVDIQNQTVIYNETILTTGGDFWNLTAFYPESQNYSAFSRTYFFNVTSDQPPTWSGNNTDPLSPTNYSPAKNYQFNITCEDDFGVSEVILEFNGTNYSKLSAEISQDGDVYYKTLTDLSVNETGYSYKWFANDTTDQWSSTGSYWLYIINKNNSQNYMNLTINGTENNKQYTYPAGSNATGWHSIPQLTFNLYRNDTPLGNNNPISDVNQFGTGFYIYTYNTTGNDNYTSSSKNYNLTIQKNTTNPVRLFLNDNEDNLTVIYPTSTNATGAMIYSDSGTADLFRNDSSVGNPEIITLGAAVYEYRVNTTGNDNYTENSTGVIYYLTVNKSSTNMSLWLNDTPDNYSYYQNDWANFTAKLNVSGKTIKLNSSYTGWSEISNDTVIYNTTQLNTLGNNYNLTAYWDGDENYSADSQTYFFDVVTNQPPAWSNNQSSIPSEYNPAFLAEFNITWEDAETSADVVFIEQNWTNPSGENLTMSNDTYGGYIYNYSVILPAGTYYWKSFANDTQNAWGSSDEWTFTINQANNPADLYFNNGTEYKNDNVTITYGTQTNVTGIIEYTSGNLYRNDSDANSENDTFITLPGGDWEYTVNTSGNQNYSANSTTYFIFVNKGAVNISLWLNGTENNRTYTQNQVANFTATINVTGLTINLTSNYTGWVDIQNQTVIYNETTLTTIGDFWNLTAFYPESQNYSAFSRTYFFNVTTNQPPQWSANDTSVPNGTEYVPGRNYGFQINWTDPETSVSVVIFEFNETNYTDVSDNGENTYWYNLTDLPAGTWNYTWYANDTQDVWNYEEWNYTVIRATSNSSLTILPSSPIAYGTQSNATCTEDNLEADGNLYRNDSLANTENNTYITLPAETWEYICNVTSTQNYTSATNSSIYIVQKANPTTNMHIAINGSETDQIKQYPNSTNITAWETNTNDDGCSYNLYRNDSSTSNPELLELEVGNYTYIYNTSSCANYSSGSITRILNITKGSTSLTLSNNLSWSGTYPSPSNTSGENCPAQLSCNLYRNDTGSVLNPDEVLLGAGAYNYTFNATGNANYSSNSTWNILIISKVAVNISLWLNDSENNETYNIYDIANFTAQSNVSGLTVNISTNLTGWTEPSGTTTVYNTTNLTETGVFNITGYTQGNDNYSESSRTYYATVLGAYLEMELIEPTGTKLVREGESFLLNASIACRAANCGDINITPRYNENVINTTGTLYVGEPLRNCTLNKDESCFANWTVSTTTIGTWNIDVNASNSVSNETSDATLSVYRVVTEVGPGGLPTVVIHGVSPPSPLLDLEITNLTPVVFAGEDLVYTINLTNVGYNETSFDVIIHKRVIEDNKILLEDAITRSMTSGLLVTDSLKIPEDIQIGRYFFELYVEYVGRNASALATFDVKKSCMILSGASYDLSRKMLVLYTESLRNVTLRFKNNCEIELTDGILWLDGNEIEIGKISEEGFDVTIDFDKYGLHNATISYTEGLSEIEFYVEVYKEEIVGVDILLPAGILISVIVFLIFVLKIVLPKLKERVERRKVEAPKIEYQLEMFKKELKEQIIKKLKEKLEKGD